MPEPRTRTPPQLITDKGGSASLPGFKGVLKEHWHQTSTGSNLHFFASAPGVGPSDGPVIVLLHGWPQTSFTWRNLIGPLSRRARLFVPDQPGIAHSTAARNGTKRELGLAYLEGLVERYGGGGSGGGDGGDSSAPLKVVLIGHDRGARISQRIGVSKAESWVSSRVEILGTVLIDIVPIKAQFDCVGDHAWNMVKYFHWGFLPVTDLSVPMILAYGGDKFCRAIMKRQTGTNEQGIARVQADNATEIYAAWYARQDTNEAAVEDYRAAAKEDYEEMKRDQQEGRKLSGNVMVLHTEYLATMHDVLGTWKEYYHDDGDSKDSGLQVIQAEPGYGHNLQEECPEWVLAQVEAFLDDVGV